MNTSKIDKQLKRAFIDAVQTWQAFVAKSKAANKKGSRAEKSIYMRAVFFWRKRAEELQKQLKTLMLGVAV